MGSSRIGCTFGLRVIGWQAFCTDVQRYTLLQSQLASLTDLITDDGQWGADIFNGHAIGCNSVSWAPAIQPGSLIHPQQPATQPAVPVKRFASAGCDNLVRIWGYSEDTQSWVEEEMLDGHTDWVRDVAWASSIGLPKSYIATASQVCWQIDLSWVFCLTVFVRRTRRC
jgi:WD40 repeat protein